MVVSAVWGVGWGGLYWIWGGGCIGPLHHPTTQTPGHTAGIQAGQAQARACLYASVNTYAPSHTPLQHIYTHNRHRHRHIQACVRLYIQYAPSHPSSQSRGSLGSRRSHTMPGWGPHGGEVCRSINQSKMGAAAC